MENMYNTNYYTLQLINNNKYKCLICNIQDNPNYILDKYKLKCKHIFHINCFKKYCDNINNINCPKCRELSIFNKNI